MGNGMVKSGKVKKPKPKRDVLSSVMANKNTRKLMQKLYEAENPTPKPKR